MKKVEYIEEILEELQRNARWSIQRKNERIEELEKQIK